MPSLAPGLIALLLVPAGAGPPQEAPAWATRRLDATFRGEGCTFGDIDGDGELDFLAGGAWYRGPEFREQREIHASQAWDPAHYSDHFFDFVADFDGDGRNDVLVVGFPGQAAHWYRNPGPQGERWERCLALSAVDNESPTFVDLTGDGRAELVCQTGGRFGWAEPDSTDPRAPWTFHALSPVLEIGPFTHGLGAGDVDGDGRLDLLEKSGWWRQPEVLDGDAPWRKHEAVFGTQGGAQMFAYDIDGDGDNDVLTSLAAHGFGLAWFEQVRGAGGAIDFREHLLVGAQPSDSPHGVRFGELHALTLCDVDGDGLQDLVTGKRWWSHGAQGDPEPGASAVLYWFRLVRGAGGSVDFVPQLVHADSGVGVDVAAVRGAGGGAVAIGVSNKKGTFVHVLGGRPSDPPPANPEGERPADSEGRALNLDLESGGLADWSAEGTAFDGQPIDGDTVAARGREPSLHAGRYWIGGYERHGDDRLGVLTSRAFRVTRPWASFLVGGGASEDTRVEIVACDEAGRPVERVLYSTSGADFESMQRVIADLSAAQGGLAAVRLVDAAKGHWGHINFDDLRLHAERPVFEAPRGVPPILALDPPRPAGRTPAAAAAAMSVPEGFHVELIAAEPDLHQPVAFTFDSRGRLWVAEAFTYPRRAPEGEGRDDLVVFEDRDRDGSFETRTVFASGLNLVSGFEVGFGGVWVGAAPYLLFVPDREGDLLPDGPPEVVLDGWGYEDTHETLNSFIWGPDGWLYGCHGVFTHSRVGAPGTPDSQRVPLNAGVWRFHPTQKRFEVFAWGTSNPWGVDFDDRGQAFATACVIPHLFHVIQGARYIRQAGAHFDEHAWGELDTIADHRHWLGPSPHTGNLRSDSAGGGHAHCGAAIYLGDTFPARYRNTLFTSNIHGNRINHELLERAGSGFVGRHGDDFLLANDAWFRGISAKVGPDGALYVIDWYDAQACHLTDPERWDRTNGRLYRVVYGEHEPATVDLPDRTGPQLAALQLEDNDWTVRRARLVLAERAPDKGAHAALRSILRNNPDSTRRLRALWALHASGGLDEATLLSLLVDPQEDLRAWAVQLSLQDRAVGMRMLSGLVRRAGREVSPVVRLYMATGLQRMALQERWLVASSLVRRAEDADDVNLPLMLWWGIEPLVGDDPERAIQLARGTEIPLVAQNIARRAALEPEALEPLCQALVIERDPLRLEALLAGFELALRGRRDVAAPNSWPVLWGALNNHQSARVRELALSLAAVFADPAALPRLRAILADPAAEMGERERALERLVSARDAQALPLLLAALDEPALAVAALQGLAVYDEERIAGQILARYDVLEVTARRTALDSLATRTSWAGAMLDAVDAERVPAADVHPAVLRRLRALGEPGLSARVEARWGVVRSTAGEQTRALGEWKAKLTAQALARADVHRGRELYEANCGLCHPLHGAGGGLGPDLSGSNRADLDYLLENVLDPSAVVPKEYLETLVWLIDGRMLSGVALRASDERVVLRTQTETHEIPRGEIETLRESGLSAMPEGLFAALEEDEVRDLVAYLARPGQVEPLARPDTVLFDGASLAGWRGDSALWSVEEGEIVGRTQGLARNAFLVSEVALRDFALTLEVRLVGDEGNSGIQFRSRALPDGDVAGYQADIGPGWWGKLYEEHGRGMLSEGSGLEQVRKDGWNSYEIVARGGQIVTRINGVPCVDLEDPEGARSGVLALQLHSGGATEVRVRNLRLLVD
jgi:putative membrane-bound dehydrogenase-like protein